MPVIHRLRCVAHDDGQTTVEFALILIPLLLVVVGIIQFGIAISFWQDQQRLATQGARAAIVNCAQASWCTPTLEESLESRTLSNGNNPAATVCFESKTGDDGTVADPRDSITVDLRAPFQLVPLFGFTKVTLTARTTMRMEQKATNPGIASAPLCP